jgi:hypothetical protein
VLLSVASLASSSLRATSSASASATSSSDCSTVLTISSIGAPVAPTIIWACSVAATVEEARRVAWARKAARRHRAGDRTALGSPHNVDMDRMQTITRIHVTLSRISILGFLRREVLPPVMKRARAVCFVTGNANKLRELSSKLASMGADIDLTSQNVDLPELQGTPEDIATKKAQQAAELVGAAVLVEDTCLQFHALKGLPVSAVAARVSWRC